MDAVSASVDEHRDPNDDGLPLSGELPRWLVRPAPPAPIVQVTVLPMLDGVICLAIHRPGTPPLPPTAPKSPEVPASPPAPDPTQIAQNSKMFAVAAGRVHVPRRVDDFHHPPVD
jgi:hypothetical protein